MISPPGGENPTRFEIPLPDGRVSPISIGPGAISGLPAHLRALGASRFAIITDSNLEATHGAFVSALIREAGFDAVLLAFPAGEINKTRASKSSLEDRMIDAGLGRDCAVVAVGGGVTGD